MGYAQTKISPGERDTNIQGYFEIQINHLIPARRLDIVISNKKKENLPNSGLSSLAGREVNEEIDK